MQYEYKTFEERFIINEYGDVESLLNTRGKEGFRLAFVYGERQHHTFVFERTKRQGMQQIGSDY